ncbi:MAG: vanadium nitrogenase [Lachnospiraceae bacterium]|nr:vanadium nitrogenase [Lachnospiraceae bacterium]
MNNLILFVNSLLSYLLVFVVIVIVAGIAIFIGITMRKKKNAQEALEAETADAEEAVAAE